MRDRYLSFVVFLFVLFVSVYQTFGQCSPSAIISGNGLAYSGEAAFGYMISGMSDLDGDDLPDIIVARTKDYFSTKGGVFAYSGLTGDSIKTVMLANKIYSMLNYGDYDKDGTDDIWINGRVYSGATSAILKDHSATTLNGEIIKDLNNDGYNDIVIGAFTWSNGSYSVGRTDVISGFTGDTLMSWVGQGTYSGNYKFGQVAASAGDFNGDGVEDIMISEPGNDYGGTDRGRFYVFSGTNAQDTLFTKIGSSAYSDFPVGLAAIGDVDGDGYDDIAAVENEDLKNPAIYIISGLTAAVVDTIPMPSGAKASGIGTWPSSIACAGDIDGDGNDDILIGDYSYSSNRGRVQLYSGIDRSLMFSSSTSFGVVKMGYSVAGVGDVDGDGDLEYAAGAPWVPDPDGSPTDMLGGAYLFGCLYPDSACLADNDKDGDGLGNQCDNCPWYANRNQEDSDKDGIGDQCERTVSTYVGSGVAVDLYLVGQGIRVVFDSITESGQVDLETSYMGPDEGSLFAIEPSDPPRYVNISTTCAYSGTVSVRLTYSDAGMSPEEEMQIAVWHYNGSAWENITVERDTIYDWVRGETTTLSPFALGTPLACCGAYVGGLTGNTDCGADGKINLGDVVRLIDRVYLTKTPLCCEENGNTDGDIDGKKNLSDINRLIDKVYLSKADCEPCM